MVIIPKSIMIILGLLMLVLLALTIGVLFGRLKIKEKYLKSLSGAAAAVVLLFLLYLIFSPPAGTLEGMRLQLYSDPPVYPIYAFDEKGKNIHLTVGLTANGKTVESAQKIEFPLLTGETFKSNRLILIDGEQENHQYVAYLKEEKQDGKKEEIYLGYIDDSQGKKPGRIELRADYALYLGLHFSSFKKDKKERINPVEGFRLLTYVMETASPSEKQLKEKALERLFYLAPLLEKDRQRKILKMTMESRNKVLTRNHEIAVLCNLIGEKKAALKYYLLYLKDLHLRDNESFYRKEVEDRVFNSIDWVKEVLSGGVFEAGGKIDSMKEKILDAVANHTLKELMEFISGLPEPG